MAILQSPGDARRDRGLVTPVWHTIVFLFVLLGLAFLQGRQQPKLGSVPMASRLALYAAMIAFELVLFLYVWLFGLKLTGTRIRDVMGGKWSSLAEVARDMGVALLFWLVVASVLLTLEKILGENTTGLGAVKTLLPRGPMEMAVWIVLCTTAGFCEEFIFRGYLQRQFLALTGRVELAVVFQAIVFGIAHMYQGVKGVITISIYGAMFGILAVMRKSLRPGMIQHAGQDIFSGIVGGILARRHYF
ncbi:MAG: type II CAAX endopeptidase family protein [Candidatus Acidiferrales bacterium]|jgi:membrane protease YdiL (CAAX protease family)